MIERIDTYFPNRQEFTAIQPSLEIQRELGIQYLNIFYPQKIYTSEEEDKNNSINIYEDMAYPERRQYESPIEAALFS